MQYSEIIQQYVLRALAIFTSCLYIQGHISLFFAAVLQS